MRWFGVHKEFPGLLVSRYLGFSAPGGGVGCSDRSSGGFAFGKGSLFPGFTGDAGLVGVGSLDLRVLWG